RHHCSPNRRPHPTMAADLALQSGLIWRGGFGGGFDGTGSRRRMRRVVVFGTTGSGKTTLANRLARPTGFRVVELDALFWGRDWQPAPVDLFRFRVECEIGQEGWIVVGNYGQVRDLVWRPADTLIWLDLPLRVVMVRLLWRTLHRVLTKEELW